MKNHIKYLLILVAFSGMTTIGYSLDLTIDPLKVLTVVSSNVEMSDNIADPPVNNSVEVVRLTFSEPLDKATVQGSVKLFRIDGKGTATEVPL